MVRFVLFTLTVLILNSAQAQMCLDLFTRPEVPLTAFTEQRTVADPATDIRQHGHMISGATFEGLVPVQLMMAQRDGTYPVIIDIYKNVMIDHRLPDPNVGPHRPFLGTHRGLYENLYAQLTHRPRIVFAGQIRVVGGKPVNIIDQAGTFYQTIEQFTGPNPMASLIAANQARLDWSADYLRTLGLVSDTTQRINFRSHFSSYGSSLLNEGHVTARRAAEFERQCRRSPSCWQNAQLVDGYVRMMMENGGQRWLMDNMKTWIAQDRQAIEMISWLSLLSKEGTFDVMAGPDVVNPSSERGVLFERFLRDLPHFLGPLP